MSTEKTTKAAAAVDPMEELVEIQLFKDGNRYKDDVFVAINGERVQIKRGVPVKVKRKFAQVIEQSRAQDLATANMIAEQGEAYRAEASGYGM